jgi:glyoxylase-like metal-dependent hydrolase (beta-lactamase superfamily II)
VHGITEPAAGIRIIRLPLPFELNHVNVGLVALDHGFMLIDTGMDTEEAFTALSGSLSKIGVAWNDIRTILITHMHPDHIGMLPRLRALTGAQVLIHRVEADYLNAMVTAGRAPSIDEGLELAGSPQSIVLAIHHSLSDLRRALKHLVPDVALEGGEEIPTALGPAQIIWTPGHSVGHVCLYWPDRKLMYAGDHMIQKITPNIPWIPGRDCLAEYLSSLDKLIPFEIEQVLPSHGDPFSNHVQWIRQTTEHHAQRCDEITAALSKRPLTAHQLVPELWNRHLSPFHYHFALFEVLAHLEHMRRKERIQVRPVSGGGTEWFNAS